jgi:CRISPR-associated protein Csd1
MRGLKERVKTMSWIRKLYDTYEYCKTIEQPIEINNNKTPLLPIAHSTQNAQIEVILNKSGDFVRARQVEKDKAVTIIPVTEDSATRSSGIAPHPLCDKLQYVAGDYVTYVEKNNGAAYYSEYIKNLELWCQSIYEEGHVSLVLQYLKKKTLMNDLIKERILICDKAGKLDLTAKIAGIPQADAFIRYRIQITGEKESAVWLNEEIYKSYIHYYLSLQEDVGLCYVKGEIIPCAEKHPAKVRHTGDKAKLISANDTAGFTYRGRFSDKSQVMGIGYEISQKAHNALRWLIEKQGYKNGEHVIVAWGTENQNLPKLLEDTQDGLFGSEAPLTISTQKSFADRLNKAVSGYSCDLNTKAEVVIMGLDAATTGRLSITYYREVKGHDFLERIKAWHSTCSWQHSYKKLQDGVDEMGKPKFKWITFLGAPSPKDIVLAAYGERVNDKLKRATIERLLPCIIDGARLPYDLVNLTVNRASNPVAIEPWEWRKVLTIACALVRKHKYDNKSKGVWDMALDETQKDRSYIFGRLLAIAQEIEEEALYVAGEKRETNAERLMHQFRFHPYKTWGIITDKLRPYIARLGFKGGVLKELMTRVNAMLPYEEFISLKKLDDSYILGYYCQRQIFIDEKNLRIEAAAKKKIEKIQA